jgi:hypothetical protein
MHPREKRCNGMIRFFHAKRSRLAAPSPRVRGEGWGEGGVAAILSFAKNSQPSREAPSSRPSPRTRGEGGVALRATIYFARFDFRVCHGQALSPRGAPLRPSLCHARDRKRIARRHVAVTSSAKPVRSKERVGVAPAFQSSVTPVSPDQSNKRRKRNAGKRRSPTAASCDAARALLERARLPAFHRGSHLREYLIPKAQLQARLPGTWSERALPAFACPSPGMHLPPRS